KAVAPLVAGRRHYQHAALGTSPNCSLQLRLGVAADRRLTRADVDDLCAVVPRQVYRSSEIRLRGRQHTTRDERVVAKNRDDQTATARSDTPDGSTAVLGEQEAGNLCSVIAAALRSAPTHNRGAPFQVESLRRHAREARV